MNISQNARGRNWKEVGVVPSHVQEKTLEQCSRTIAACESKGTDWLAENIFEPIIPVDQQEVVYLLRQYIHSVRSCWRAEKKASRRQYCWTTWHARACHGCRLGSLANRVCPGWGSARPLPSCEQKRTSASPSSALIPSFKHISWHMTSQGAKIGRNLTYFENPL